MAIHHRSWRFNIAEAQRVFKGFSTLDDLLQDDVTRAATRVRANRDLKDHLVMARLDPTDDEVWDEILNPSPADSGYESATASRMMLLLTEVCVDGGGIRTPPFFVEEHLAAAGWPKSRIELALRGRRLETFFETHATPLRDVANRCRFWLAGGWLDADTAGELETDLDRDTNALEIAAAEVIPGLSESTWLSEQELETKLRTGIDDLGSMLAQVDEAAALWIIQD